MLKEKIYQALIIRPELKDILANYFVNKAFPQVLLLEGERGSGKMTLALSLAYGLLSDCCSIEDLQEDNQITELFINRSHPDLYILPSLEERFSKIKIEDLRQNLLIETSLFPSMQKNKVWIIDLDSVSEQGQNSLLKILEEAKTYCYFILLSSNKEKILDTVLSRAQKIKLNALSDEAALDLINFEKKYNQSIISDLPKDLDFIIKIARGNPSQLIKFLTNDEWRIKRQEILEFLLHIHEYKAAKLFEKGLNISKEEKENIFFLRKIITSWLTDLALINERKIQNIDYEADLLSQAKIIRKSKHSILSLQVKIDEIFNNLEYNVNFEISMQYLFILLKIFIDNARKN